MYNREEIKGIKRKEQISHIFTGEDPSEVKESQKRHVKTQQSSVIFNDSYVEKNPDIKPGKKKRYLIEEKIRAESGYTDDIKKGKEKNVAFQRKIKDSYLNNPMKIYNKEDNKKYNEDERQKYAHRAKAFNNVFGSDKCKRTLGGISKRTNVDMAKQNSDKVTNNSFNITHNAMILNRDENQQVPYYGRRHFITCNSGNGKGMTYL